MSKTKFLRGGGINPFSISHWAIETQVSKTHKKEGLNYVIYLFKKMWYYFNIVLKNIKTNTRMANG